MIKIFMLAILLMLILFNSSLVAQEAELTDTLKSKESTSSIQLKSFIIPAALVTYGFIGIESDGLKAYNSELRDEITEDIDERVTIDDFMQHTPVFSVYGLNLLGIKGKNNFRDRTIILAFSYLIMGGSVFTLKETTKIERPDKSSFNSFPSGHTATAFMGAEFLWQEYKDVSIWYGISGYVLAAGTGIFRMYNNRHWLTDVAAGAGIGMASTKISYLIYPYLKRTFSKKQKESMTLITPYYNGKEVGFNLYMIL